MREGKFIETKKETTNTFVERGPGVSKEEFDKGIFDYQKKRQRHSDLLKVLGPLGSDIAECVKEPSPREEKIIDATLDAAEEVINQYSSRRIRLSKTNIFLLRKEEVIKKFGVSETEGGRSRGEGMIFVNTGPTMTESALAHIAAHELVHHASFHRLKVLRDGQGQEVHEVEERSGLTIGDPYHGFSPEDGGYTHFEALNEAITEQIAIEIVSLLKQKTRLLEEDYTILKRVYDIDSPRYPLGKNVEKPEHDDQYVYTDSYADRVDALRVTCQELYEKNRERFSSPQDVFRVFSEAYFSGKLLTLARLIEKNYGKGAFRFIADYENHEWNPS